MRRAYKAITNISKRVVVLVLIPILLLGTYFWWRPQKAQAQTDTFTVSGTWNVPAGVSSAIFEAWGGGGTGGPCLSGGGSAIGGGGAGGQYAKTTLTGLNFNDAYTVTVGAVTTAQTVGSIAGSDSYVTNPSSTIFVEAKGGGGGGANGAAATGSTTGGIGDSVFAGGNGSAATGSTSGAGGGGAGSGGAGGNASGTTAGTGTTTNGGNGGAGLSATAVGNPGNNYGGAGSGGLKTSGGTKVGGNGAAGLVTVTYTVSNSPPNAPTLSTPSSGATGVSITPSFTLSTTDPDSDTIKYRLYLYQSDCSTAISGSPFAQSTTPTGWDNGSTAYTSGSTATYSYQSALSYNTTYCWKADAIDPTGSNSYGTASSTRLFTTLANTAPNAPSLTAPASGTTNVSVTPSFTLSTTDTNGDTIKYRLYLYQSDCSTAVGTSPFAQASDPTGWDNGSTAYTSGATATYTYQGSLATSTTYCWKADAIDPTGSNTYGSASATQLFTTAASTTVNLNGGVNIIGGTTIQ